MAAFQSQLYLERIVANDADFEEDELYLTLQQDPALPPATLPNLPPSHFLSIARSAHAASTGSSANRGFDTSTVAAADFDVDARTGFMPPRVPVVKLSGSLDAWERKRDEAVAGEPLTLGMYATPTQKKRSAAWRRTVDSMPLLSITSIRQSEVLLRRAHSVLTFILHFYIHSQPPLTNPAPPPVSIPPSLAVPLMALSKELLLPPILTYSDNVLYNWTLIDPKADVTVANIAMDATFSLTQSEKHFYITSARIEIRGVEALELMRSSMDEAFIADTLSLRRITGYLHRLAGVIDEMTVLLMAVRDECDPDVFYNQIRPWFRGWEPGSREWLFEGVDEEDQRKYARMSGPSAGQSSLIHALDVFLGVDHTHQQQKRGVSLHDNPTFLMKMEMYMPRHHRAFLQHLRSANQTHVRSLIMSGTGTTSTVHQALQAAYDEAVTALKRFRDGHIRIATLYIVSQARKAINVNDGVAASATPTMPRKLVEEDVRGTGGTSLVPFLKEARDNTMRTAIGGGRPVA